MSSSHRLKRPIERKDFVIDELTIGEATGDTMLLVDDFAEKPVRLTMELIANLAEFDGRRGEISFSDVRKMAAEDIEALGELVQNVLGDGRQTGLKR